MTEPMTLEGFVSAARAAAGGPDPLEASIALMMNALTNPSRIASDGADFVENEVLLFEDETVSIWHERFLPDEILPAHDHQMPAILGVYDGQERNRLFRQVDGTIASCGELVLAAGEFHVFGPEDIHTVQAMNDAPSHGLHIYLGALTRVERSLFDVEAGARMPMTEADFVRLTRKL